jgi:hypothetical protein
MMYLNLKEIGFTNAKFDSSKNTKERFIIAGTG